ncbi:MAG: alkaline phosphatase family protein [Kiritimatiellae bacterium]|nr:alkaline phosphatase family protein [Kiritimatiellia bacterium]
MKILIIQVAGLGLNFASDNGLTEIEGFEVKPLQPLFPGLTCTAQATLRTASAPAQHGMIANGFMERTLRRPLFWEQSSALVKGERLWESLRGQGGTVAMTFFQQSLGESVDQIISPAPIHKHNGGMIMDCSSTPESLYAGVQQWTGSPFKLHRYWGPLASTASSRWIAKAVAGMLSSADAPELLITYLPCLDYALQRYGTRHSKSKRAAQELRRELTLLFKTAQENGYHAVAYGDYAISDVTGGAVFPNQALRNAGLFKTRRVRKMLYPDLHQSRAFAVVDHQVAMVTCFDQSAIQRTAEVLQALEGVGGVTDAAGQRELQVDHPRSGDLLMTAKPGYWFAYPWWHNPSEAPEYAGHVDIHNKPGYDPCELFFGSNPFRTSQDTSRIKGTHGLAGPDCETALFSSLPLKANSLLTLAKELKTLLSP